MKSYWSIVERPAPAPYYTYVQAAIYLGLSFDMAVETIRKHAQHSGIDISRSVNTLPVAAVETIPTCEHCNRAQVA
jgi:hypothetical protein